METPHFLILYYSTSKIKVTLYKVVYILEIFLIKYFYMAILHLIVKQFDLDNHDDN